MNETFDAQVRLRHSACGQRRISACALGQGGSAPLPSDKIWQSRWKEASVRRRFTPKERRFLFVIGRGRCGNCGCALDSRFHADHILAFSRSGETVLRNGQALCPDCNLKKGAAIDAGPSPTARLAD